MKTPVSILLMVITYWIAIYGISIVPHFSENYNLNLVWLTVIVPNVLRYIIGNVPRLAVDRIFFLTTSIIALVITFAVNAIWGESREAVEKYGSDRSKTLKLSALLMTAFATGALITYYTGIDNSIYSNMGWESNNVFMTSQSNL